MDDVGGVSVAVVLPLYTHEPPESFDCHAYVTVPAADAAAAFSVEAEVPSGYVALMMLYPSVNVGVGVSATVTVAREDVLLFVLPPSVDVTIQR